MVGLTSRIRSWRRGAAVLLTLAIAASAKLLPCLAKDADDLKKPDPTFKNFGLPWSQTDVHAGQNGNANVSIRTILLDQIFGFDPEVGLDQQHVPRGLLVQ